MTATAASEWRVLSAAEAGRPGPAHDARPTTGHRVVRLGRQPIVTRCGRTLAYEFLYRDPTGRPVSVDQWPARYQDLATSAVLASVFGGDGVSSVAAEHAAFVNVTRSYLTGPLPVPDEPGRLVLEIVETVPADSEVVAGVARLRDRGFRIALDDFEGLDAQVALLPWADYVKVDARAFARLGTRLVDLAASCGAVLVAERVEDEATVERCAQAGFTLFQGNVFEATSVLRREPVMPSPRRG